MAARDELTVKQLLTLWFKTLFYNSCLSWAYAMDTCIEPLLYIVDHTTAYIGRLFVCVVYVLIGSVVIIAHLLGIPIYWEQSPSLTVLLIVIGYWFLLNVVFNYTQGVRVSPGLPSNPNLCSSATICKKCISPKPIRTHHCSICNRCYLKMDHHCPWMNNCIGHFNHRYFFLSMTYIIGGCVFLMIFGIPIAYRQILLDEDILPFTYEQVSNQSQSQVYPVPSLSSFSRISKLMSPMYFPNDDSSNAVSSPVAHARLLFGIPASKTVVVTMIYYVALLIIGATVALGILCYWHAKLIGKGETSIESHINVAQKKRLGDSFSNPYDKGRRRNWEILFGLDQGGRTFWRHVLLPSTHAPTGNGYDWNHLLDNYVDSTSCK